MNAVAKPHRGRSVGFNFYKKMLVGAARGRQGGDSTPTFAVNSDDKGSGVPHRLASLSLFAVARLRATHEELRSALNCDIVKAAALLA